MRKRTDIGSLKQRRENKFKKRALFWLTLFFILFLAALTYGTYLYVKADLVFSDAYEDYGKDKSGLRKEAVLLGDDNGSILIMGVDTNDSDNVGDHSRTDTLMN